MTDVMKNLYDHEWESKRYNLTIINGIGTGIAKRLISNGVDSIKKLAESKPSEIARIRGINLKEAYKLVEAAKLYVNTEDRVDILKYIGTMLLKQD